MKIVFHDERTGDGETFQYERGILEFVEYLNRASEPVHPDIIYIAGEYDGVGVEIAMQYSSEYTENVHSYVNNINTTEGGTHLSGFRTALTRSLNTYGKKENLFKDLVPTGDDFREGLTAVISLRVPAAAVRRPDQDQARQQRGRRHRQLGSSASSSTKYLEENPKTAKVDRARRRMLAAEAREAARKARELVRERKGALGRRRPARQAPRLHQPATSTSASCTWSKAIRPAAAPRAAACASTRRSCRCAARSSTPTSRAKTKCWPTKKSAA